MIHRFQSVRLKLLAIVLLTTLTALLVSLAAILTAELRNDRDDLIAGLSTQADLLGRMSAAALSFDDKQLATENLHLLRLWPKVKAAAIYDAHGKLFASYARPGSSPRFPALPSTDGIQTDGEQLAQFKRIVINGQILGTVYLRAGYDWSGHLLHHAGFAVAAMLFSLLLAYFMVSRLHGVVTHPILSIVEIARNVVTQRDYSRRATKLSDDEIGILVDAFNNMLAEIEQRTRALETSNREIAHEVEERSHAQQEIMRLNAVLESRVRERTAQLEATFGELALAKEAAENANQAKSAFLSSMSHELRTPLNAILGFAQILTTDTLPTTPEQKVEFAGYILKSGRHLLDLINDILDLAKIESGHLTLSLEPVGLAEVMDEMRAMTEPLCERKGIRMLFPESIVLAVEADRIRLKQILLNLLSNAIKYNREQGTVVVNCSAPVPGYIRIAVQDTGTGLTSEQLTGLFQPFNRLGQEGGAEEGTGIGLVVTKRLVEQMGGQIGASSTPGMGSVFWFELKDCPAPPGGAADQDHDEAPPAALDNPALPTLLYVEDNPANLRLVEEIVHARGDLRMLSAPDAHLGIQLAHAHRPHLILMDLNLPGMSGLEALRLLHATESTARIPVIALTANAHPSEVKKGLAAGFFRYLVKPLDIAEFTDAVNSALALSTPTGESSEGADSHD